MSRPNRTNDESRFLRQGIERLGGKYKLLTQVHQQSTFGASKSESTLYNQWDLSSAARDMIEESLNHQEGNQPNRSDYGRQCLNGDKVKSNLILRSGDGTSVTSLISLSRAKYLSIVEDLLTNETPDDEVTRVFREKHGYEGFLCSYTRCPHATRGFKSAKLRQEHEKGHEMQYNCTDSACSHSGWMFRNRAALRRHIAKYHGKDKDRPVPDTLNQKLRSRSKERPLFSFKSRPSQDRASPGAQTPISPTQILRPFTIPPSERSPSPQLGHEALPGSQKHSDVVNNDLSNPDLLENFDFDQFLQNDDAGDFNFDPVAFKPNIRSKRRNAMSL
ncbi:hypothetical protein ACLMJK_008637 [Lecanora helva]